MQVFIAILRGINVGGHRIIKMDFLRQIFGVIGMKDVKTYIQSGNVVFRSDINDIGALAELIRDTIQKSTGFDVKTIVIEAQDFLNKVASNPYIIHEYDMKQLFGTFLETEPHETTALSSIDTSNDTFILGNKIIYLKCVGSYHTSPLTNEIFEKKLKISCTTRNWKTILTIKTMIEEMLST
ncbi:MAG: DUF1697 domain-containing protein [Saprospiraceae bacterium]